MDKKSVSKNYRFLAILLCCMIAGALVGWFWPDAGHKIAFLGKVFINLMFCIVVPLVFSSIAGSVANMDSRQRAGKIMATTIGTFVVTGAIAAVIMFVLMKLFPPVLVPWADLAAEEIGEHATMTEMIVNFFTAEDFVEKRPRGVIGMVNGEITTADAGYSDRIDTEYDVLKIAVVERHKNTHHIGIGYLQGYGLRSGAVATSISHDSHNIIVVGTTEADMAAAVNRVVELNGGIVVWDDGRPAAEVPLAIAGIMSDEPLAVVNEKLERAKAVAHSLGVGPGIDPFMTLSFMALPVIPSLRITTRGVFDVTTQSYV